QTFLIISSFLAEVFIMLSATLRLTIKRINTSAVRRMVIKSEFSKDILLTVIKISMSIYPNVQKCLTNLKEVSKMILNKIITYPERWRDWPYETRQPFR